MAVRRLTQMRLMLTIVGAACLLCGCTSDETTAAGSARYVYDDWLYYNQDWYDDDFWIWVDDHPDCCDDAADLREALQDWYDELDPGQQQAVRHRAQTWMDEHGAVPAAGQSAKDPVLETASERWAALTPRSASNGSTGGARAWSNVWRRVRRRA